MASKAEVTELRPKKDTEIIILPPNFQVLSQKIEGTAPYVCNAFSLKTEMMLMEKHREGGKAKSKKERKPRNFEAEYKAAFHVSEEGWYGIPAAAFRCAMIDVCRVAGFVMARAKLAIFIIPDGYDKTNSGTPLVRIYGRPVMCKAAVKLATGVVDIRVRPMWKKWHATPKIRFDADLFGPSDVANLLWRAGEQNGIGEGRPNSKDGFGVGWGTLVISDVERV